VSIRGGVIYDQEGKKEKEYAWGLRNATYNGVETI
jgi:hypothetical protein